MARLGFAGPFGTIVPNAQLAGTMVPAYGTWANLALRFDRQDCIQWNGSPKSFHLTKPSIIQK